MNIFQEFLKKVLTNGFYFDILLARTKNSEFLQRKVATL